MQRKMLSLSSLGMLILFGISATLMAATFTDNLVPGSNVTHNYTCSASDGMDPIEGSISTLGVTNGENMIYARIVIVHNGEEDLPVLNIQGEVTEEFHDWGNVEWDVTDNSNNTINYHYSDGPTGNTLFKTYIEEN